MIIDCFPYFNEKELLELRIRLLYTKVDRFIITEADHTHSGKPKELTLLETLKRIDVPLDKILYVPVMLPSAEEEPSHWVRERMQRDAAAAYIKESDLVFVSDCDEILNPKYIDYAFQVKMSHPKSILRTPMTYLCGRADLRVYDTYNTPISWNSPYIVSGKQLKDYSLSEIREDHAWRRHALNDKDIYITEDNSLKELGWHFTWMGNLERLLIKENSYCHAGEYTVSKDYQAKDGASDPLGRGDHILKRYDDPLLNNIINQSKRIKEFLLP